LKNHTDSPPATASAWHRATSVGPQASVLAVVGIATVITMVISYWHEYLLAHHNGQARWVSALAPFSIDGIVLTAAVALLWAAAHAVKGWRRLWRPVLWLAVGVVVTISANFFSDVTIRWLGPGVSASTGVALILISDVAFWLLAESRRLANPVPVQPLAGHACPPPPLTVADALALAREELRRLGEPSGEQALADRFGVTRHQVRSALAPPQPVPSLNGTGAP
jgi:hypothetical protein